MMAMVPAISMRASRAIKPLARSSHDRQPITESARDSWHRIDRLHVRADTGWDSNWLNDGKLLKKYVLSSELGK
jgi:hypothetical protein